MSVAIKKKLKCNREIFLVFEVPKEGNRFHIFNAVFKEKKLGLKFIFQFICWRDKGREKRKSV